jgi:hypothetical protein
LPNHPSGDGRRADAGFAGVGHPRPESKRLTDRSHHGSAKPSRTSIGYSGGRDRTCASRLTVACLTARPHRNEEAEAAGFEPAERQAALRGSSALPFHSAMPPLRRKERESNPQGRSPPVFETGYRTRWQSFPKGDPGRARTCTTPIKSRPLYRIELRSQRCGRQESNLQRPAFQAGALPDWSYDHASGRGWNRTSDLLFVRQALGLSELLARV